MEKYLIKEFKSKLSHKILPLTVHYAIIKEYDVNDEGFKTRQIDGNLPKCYNRYFTKRYIPGNKFYKSISRTLYV